MLCPNCEAENRDDAKFCDECGFPLGGAIARAAAVSSPSSVSSASQSGDRWFSEPEPEPVFEPEEPSMPVVEDAVSAEPELTPGFDFEPEPSAAPAYEPSVPARDTALDSSATSRLRQASSPRPSAERDDAAPTIAFGEGDRELQGATSVITRQEQDPFAGFAPQSDEDGGFDYFGDDPLLNEPMQPNEAHAPGFTMQMPRIEGDAKPANRDFRISSSSSRRPPKAALIVIGAVATVVVVAVVTFVLGLWGGIAVPDVTGMAEADARAVLEGNGFAVRSTQVKSDDTEGLVLVMDPVAGSRAAEGSEVVIHIATPRFVPDIVGKSYDEAKALLDEAGYENVKYEKVKSTGPENVILSVSPDAGTRAKSSMEISVGVSEAYRVPDVSGMSLTAAQEAITKSGLVPQVVYVDTQEQPEGTILGTTPVANTKVSEGDYVSINVARARGAELVSLTEQLFAPGQTATVGGTSIAVDSVDSVSYLGDDTVSFKITGRPFATLMGETVYGSTTTVEGQVVWSDDNEVVSIS